MTTVEVREAPDHAVTADEELVTVVIPACNEQGAIESCLASITSQDWSNLDIIVVDGASTDRTVELVQAAAQRDSRIRLLHNPQRVIPVSLNLALEAARARWLVRVDAHAAVDPGYVRLAAEHLRTGRYGGVGGRKDGVGRTPAGRAVAAAMSSRFGVGGSTYHFGEAPQVVEHVPFGAYPVQLLREMGGWDATLLVNQDFELDYRLRAAGHTILFDPCLRIDWECRQSIGALARQYRRYGGGKVAVARKHPRSLRLRHLAAPVLIADLAAAAAIARWRPRTAVAMVVPYLAGLTAASVQTGRSLDRPAAAHVPAAFLAMHLAWGWGFWKGLAAVARRA